MRRIESLSFGLGLVMLVPLVILSSVAPAQAGHPLGAWQASTSTVVTSALRSAQAALEAEDAEDALAHLRRVHQSGGPLGRWLEALALEAQGEYEAALKALGPVPEGRCLAPASDIPRQAQTLLAARLVARSDRDRAAEILAGLNTAKALDEAVRMTTDETARTTWRARLLLEHAGSRQARETFRSLGVEAVLAFFPSVDQRLDLTEAFLEAHDNPRALALGRAIQSEVAPNIGQRCRWGYYVGKAQRKQRVYDRALAVLKRARADCAKAHRAGIKNGRYLALKSALLEARVLAIKDRRLQLDRVAAWMRAFAPGHSYIDDALLWAAESYEGKKARERLKSVVAIGGDQGPTAAWRLAQYELDRNESASARRWLEAILAMPKITVDDQQRADLYLGRIEARTSTAAAAARFEALAQRPSFYGFVALERLRDLDRARAEKLEKGLISVASAPLEFDPASAVLEANEARSALIWHQAGASEWAISELQALACQREHMSVTEVLTLAWAFDALGAHPEAQRLIRWDPRHLLEVPLTVATLPRWRLAYSRAFTQEIAKAAQTEAIDPLLLTALAREESTFDPEVVSWAGATGLAQLMPATAIGAYASVYGGRLDVERLTEPDLNLRLGARVLKSGLDSFDGLEALALSAYNGGRSLARRTLPDRRIPFEDWAESNPVGENRGYVKRVLATWGVYRLLYSGGEHAGPRIPRTVGPGPKAQFRAEVGS